VISNSLTDDGTQRHRGLALKLVKADEDLNHKEESMKNWGPIIQLVRA